jgi:hypothetical protein
MEEDLPILLSYRIEENSLILRLDRLGLQNFEIEKEAVCEFRLKNFINQENLLNDLQELIGDVFGYQIRLEENHSILEFWGIGRIQNTIEFDSIEETNFRYTMVDLQQKGKTLANLYSNIADLYSNIYEKCLQNNSELSTITNKLKIEINDEIERFQRKAEFFEIKDPSKSEAYRSQVKVLQKLSNYLENPK